MSRDSKSMDAWGFWQRSRKALDDLNDVMQVCATNIAQDDPPIELPPHTVKHTRRAVAKFEENFALMVREQKRKVGR